MRVDLGAKPILYPLPVFIVGTYDTDGQPNAMNVAWCGMVSGKPPMLELGIEPSRKTLENIRETKAFTVSIADAANVAETDYYGIASGHDVDKIDTVGHHVEKAPHVNAPVIAEFPMTVECTLHQIYPAGNCCMVIGEIVNISADENILDKDGKIDLSRFHPISFDIMHNTYVQLGEVVGKAYQAGLKYKDISKPGT